MFRKNKHENKAKLEHKLYLARENPEPVFDLSDCGLAEVPSGIYSLCRVFLKESLNLENNYLSSLSGGGHLKDLQLIKFLNISNNNFFSIPDEVYFLTNLQVINASNNQLKKLPDNICKLKHLKVLNVSHNLLKKLPQDLGNLSNLIKLDILGNKKLKHLPQSITQLYKLRNLEIDSDNFQYPPSEVVKNGLEDIMKYICDDVGASYETYLSKQVEFEKESEVEEYSDSFEAKILELENIKQQKMKEFLEFERDKELQQRQEIELANASKINKEKLLAELTEQQNLLDNELSKIHQEKEFERFRLVEQLQEMENNSDFMIGQLLTINNEPSLQLLEQEKQEEGRLLDAVNRYNETLRKEDILNAMQDILEQETAKFLESSQNRLINSQSILEQEAEMDTKLIDILQNQEEHKVELVNQLKIDNDLQKAAVATLLERGDARSWSLLQQIRLVESQLAMLTSIEMDRKKLQIDQYMSDLCKKRVNLSFLLVDLLDQQRERRLQLMSTLQTMEKSIDDGIDDFWLKQYQRLLDKLPEGLSHAQRNIDPTLAQALLVNGVIHCLPFLAKLTQNRCDIENIRDYDLLQAGVNCGNERKNILRAFTIYESEKKYNKLDTSPSAPTEEGAGASAPPPEAIKTIKTSECVVCLDMECQIIFVPCGHFCCCSQCSASITDCPLCRFNVEKKIKLVS